MLVEDLPPFWAVESFEVVATSNMGDAVTPQAAIRFEAEAGPTLPLYVLAGRQGPFDVVVPSIATPGADEEADARWTLYGVASVSCRAGAWTGDLMVENPVDALGQPLSAFGRPTLVLGSAEGDTTLALLRDRGIAVEMDRQEEVELAKMRTAHEQARAALEADGAAELAAIQRVQAEEKRSLEQEQARSVSEMEAARDEAVASQRQQLEADIAGLEKAFGEQLSELTKTNAPAIETARAQAAERLAAVEAEGVAALAAARSEAHAALEAARAAHASEKGALVETQETEIARLETRLDDRRVTLEAQLADTAEVLSLQERLTADLATIQANMELLRDVGEAVVVARAVAVDALVGRWEGIASCGQAAASASAPRCPQTIAGGKQALPEPLVCTCDVDQDAEQNKDQIWGTDIYAGGSNACIAALHAGAVGAGGRQSVVILPEAGQDGYRGSSRNGVDLNRPGFSGGSRL